MSQDPDQQITKLQAVGIATITAILVMGSWLAYHIWYGALLGADSLW